MRRLPVRILFTNTLILAVLLGSTHPSRAAADTGRDDPSHQILPPAPEERRAVRGVEVRVVQPIPAYRRPLCPEGSSCIFGVGGGFGVTVERRFQNGTGLGVDYQLWFATAEGVYELPTVMSVGAKLRRVLWPERAAHLSLQVSGGAVTFGDVFRFQTLGPYVELGVGGELEMNESLAFTLGLGIAGMTFVPFMTREDDVRRSVSPYLDCVLSLHVGILWLAPRARGR